MKRWTGQLLTGLVFALRPLHAAEAADADLYREAQIQENTAQNPEAAARLYSRFLEHAPNDRLMQADALLHLGLCEARLGQKEEARTSFKKVVNNYADQSAPYARANSELQALAVADAEHAAATAPLASTPVVKVLYEPVRTRWNLDFARVPVFHTLDSKGRFIYQASNGWAPNFDYFLKPGTLAVGLSAGELFSGSLSGGGSADILQIQPHVRIEKHLWGPLIPYAMAGPTIYRFRFEGRPIEESFDPVLGGSVGQWTGPEQSESHWTAGLSGEVGVALGWTRGFTLNLGYSVNGFPQVTPSPGFQQNVHATRDAPQAYQNHGLRWIGGPVFALAFRW